MSRVFLDTNVLAYRFDLGDPAKRQRARAVTVATGHDFVVSTQVLIELFQVLTRKLRPPMRHDRAAEVVRSLGRFHVHGADAGLVERAIDLAGTDQLSIWDAMILTAAAESGCDEVWTEDLDTGSRISGVLVVNPFAA